MVDETKRLEQLHGLSASRRRVDEMLLMMPALVERLADDGDPLARYLVEEFEKAWDIMVSENMSAAQLVADHEKTP